MLRHTAPWLALVALTLPQVAAAQAPRGAPPAMAQPPTLTTDEVQRLIRVIPELARESGAIQGGGMQAGPGGPSPEANAENLERIERVLKKHGFTFPDFVMRLNAMIAAYLVLSPEEFDKQLPNEQTPAVKKILDDPSVPAEKKAELRQQLGEMNKNKDMIRKQLTSFATDENKRVVKPHLTKIRDALAAAEKEGNKHAGQPPAAPAGPRKDKAP